MIVSKVVLKDMLCLANEMFLNVCDSYNTFQDDEEHFSQINMSYRTTGLGFMEKIHLVECKADCTDRQIAPKKKPEPVNNT